MAILKLEDLRSAIQDRNYNWQANELPENYRFKPLGNDRTSPSFAGPALDAGRKFMATRIRAFAAQAQAGQQLGVAGGPAAIPSSFDWRTQGVIGTVTDQEECGSCVSFATVGLVGAMVGIEVGVLSVHLSEADSHFCSAHGANCGGWNNNDALKQMNSRGVVADGDLPYNSAFDNPPIDDPAFAPEILWSAHCRSVASRGVKAYFVNEVLAFNGDDRKTYLANVGPLVCGFEVYTDFDAYGLDAHGVYRHVMGTLRGGHAVLVVGYSDVDNCWICRNSWGQGFGGAAKPEGVGAGFFKIGYGECDIDGEPFYGARGVIAPADSRWGGWWPVAGGVAAPGTSVFGVSRSTDKLDIFCVGTDQGTDTAAWQPGDTSWQGWWRVQGGVAAANSSVTAVSRSTDKLDIFCVGADYHVYTAAWQPGDTSWQGWWPVLGGVAAPGTSVFGVSRGPDKLDIFCVGTDHRVYTAAWQAGDTSWQGWWPVGDLTVAPNTSVFAVSRSLDHLDIFAVGADGHVYTAAWQPGDTSWQGWWPVLGGVAAPGTSVFGVSRGPDKLDIFCVGTDRRVYTAAWQAGDTSWQGWWPVGALTVAPNSSVFAVSRSLDHLDIFTIGEDSRIYTAAWAPGMTRWRGWWCILEGTAAPGTTVSAVVRSADHLDVFVVCPDFRIYTAAWQP
jgi:hypothetical protein